MPVTQPPYDATRFLPRQTSGEIDIFGSFTSVAVGWRYRPVAEELADFRREVRASILSYILYRQSASRGQGEVVGRAQACRESAGNPRHKSELQDRARRIDEPGGVPYKPRQLRARTEIVSDR